MNDEFLIISNVFFSGGINYMYVRSQGKSSSKHLTEILTARSSRRFALSVTTGVFANTSAWTDGTAVMPISSRLSLGTIGLFVTSSTKLKRRI